jgi:hypothetical protein
VLYAVLGAQERGCRYIVPQALVSGQNPGDETDNKAVRDNMRLNHLEHVIEPSEDMRALLQVADEQVRAA